MKTFTQKSIAFMVAFIVISSLSILTAMEEPNLEEQLFDAIEQDNTREVQRLINASADVNFSRQIPPNPLSITPLHHAAWHASLGSLQALLAAGANVNAVNESSYTPLHYAAENAPLPLVKALIEKGAKVNAKDIGGNTPLHYASKFNDAQVVKALLAAGADVTIENNDGQLSFDLAQDYNIRKAFLTYISPQEVQEYLIPRILAIKKAQPALQKDVQRLVRKEFIQALIDEKLQLAKQYLEDYDEYDEDALRAEIEQNVQVAQRPATIELEDPFGTWFNG